MDALLDLLGMASWYAGGAKNRRPDFHAQSSGHYPGTATAPEKTLFPPHPVHTQMK